MDKKGVMRYNSCRPYAAAMLSTYKGASLQMRMCDVRQQMGNCEFEEEEEEEEVDEDIMPVPSAELPLHTRRGRLLHNLLSFKGHCMAIPHSLYLKMKTPRQPKSATQLKETELEVWRGSTHTEKKQKGEKTQFPSEEEEEGEEEEEEVEEEE